MNKVIFSFLLIFLITSCNLPGRNSNQSPNKVPTYFSQTLTARPREGQVTANPSQTSTVVNQNTPSTQLSETPTITVTVTETVTTTVTNTPTKEPDDLKTILGNPTWKDTLDKGTAFFKDKPWVYEDDYNRISIENGKMILRSFGIGTGFRGWRLAPRKPKNFYLEATFSAPACNGSDMYGLLFRAADYSTGKGYYYGFTCDGHFNLTKWDDYGSSVIINPTSNSLILSGPNQTNRLGIKLINDKFALYANGKMIQEINDTSIQDGGYIGPFFAGQSGNFTVEMKEIAYWLLP